MTIGPVAVCVAIFAAIWLFIRYAERAGRRSAARILAQAPPSKPRPPAPPPPVPPAPGDAVTIIVPPCGCVNEFTRTRVTRCDMHAARLAARDDRAAWEAAMRKEMEQDQ
jgi:hypothetical protein